MKSIHNMEEFDKAIEQDKPRLIYFYTTWCPDCYSIKPHLPRLEEEFSNVDFYQMDRDIEIDLARHLNIFGIPSFLMFQNGQEIGRFVSKFSKTYLEVRSFIEESIKG